MQALWSPTAWNRASCRCLRCVPNSPSIASHSGPARVHGSRTARASLRRGLYSTIAAADAHGPDDSPADMDHADRRRFQSKRVWTYMKKAGFDYALVDVGSYNRALDIRVEPVADEESVTFMPGVTLIDDVWLRPREWDYFTEVTGNAFDENDEAFQHIQVTGLDPSSWELLALDSRFPGGPRPAWTPNTGRPLISHHLPPQSLWALDRARTKALRKRQSWKKLTVQELSMGCLIHSFVAHSSSITLPSNAHAQLAPGIQHVLQYGDLESSYEQSMLLDELRRVQETPDTIPEEHVLKLREGLDETYVKPRYFQDNDGHYYQLCQQANTLIKDIFSSSNGHPTTHEVRLALVKVAHNLLVCSAGPDVHTFNTLIAGLRRWKLTKLVDDTIAAVDACKIRPNEITCALILDHYIECNRPAAFAKYIRLMRGVGNALMLARPDININEMGDSRLVRPFGKVHKVYQKIHPTPLVHETLMRGVLSFAGLERALEIYFDMKGDGWGLGILGLTELLIECIRRGDWQNGLYVWEEMNTLKEAAEVPHLLTAYSHMLSLCTVTGNKAASNQLLKEVSAWGLDKKEIVDRSVKITQELRQGQTRRQRRSTKMSPVDTEAMVDHVSKFVAQGKTEATAPAEPAKEQKAATPSDAPTEPPKTALTRDELWQLWVQNELGLWKNRRAPAALPDVEGAQIQASRESLSDRLLQKLRGKKVEPAPVDPRAVMSKDELWQRWVQNELGLWKNRKAPAPLPTVGPAPLFTRNDLLSAEREQKRLAQEAAAAASAETAHVESAPLEPAFVKPTIVAQSKPSYDGPLMTPFSHLYSVAFTGPKRATQEERHTLRYIARLLTPDATGSVLNPANMVQKIETSAVKNKSREACETPDDAHALQKISRFVSSRPLWSTWRQRILSGDFDFLKEYRFAKPAVQSDSASEASNAPDSVHFFTIDKANQQQSASNRASPPEPEKPDLQRTASQLRDIVSAGVCARCFLPGHQPNDPCAPCIGKPAQPFHMFGTIVNANATPSSRKGERTLRQLKRIKRKGVCRNCFGKGHLAGDEDAPCKGQDPLPFALFEKKTNGVMARTSLDVSSRVPASAASASSA